jgi:hypothetical protein
VQREWRSIKAFRMYWQEIPEGFLHLF